MSKDANQFDIAFGQCIVRDGTLVIERPDPEELGRGKLFWRGVDTALEYRPYTRVWLAVSSLLGVTFVSLLVYLYTANPAVAPLVAVLGVLGLLAVIIPLEVSYRRALSQRRDLHATLEDEFQLVRAERIPIEDITNVIVRSVSTGVLLSDGHAFLIHFSHDGEIMTTFIGFPAFMGEEQATARMVFEQNGVPIMNDK